MTEAGPVSSVAVLPRTFLHRTRWGTAVFYDRRQGLLALDERTGRWRSVSAEELRRGYPEAFAAWLRSVALLPASTALPAPERRDGERSCGLIPDLGSLDRWSASPMACHVRPRAVSHRSEPSRPGVRRERPGPPPGVSVCQCWRRV